jgi:eukaryotic-like serine/threonine-protein kinase
MTGSMGLHTPTVTLERDALEPADGPPQPSRDLEPGTWVGGRYRLDGVLGRGGMGVVYAAHDQQGARHVALKFMTWGGDADRADRENRFVSEVRNATAVQHRHVVEVLDAGLHQGEPYLVMEFLVGESLEQRLQRVHTLAPREALVLLVPIASALAELHACGIVHRDVKPSNIFLAEVGDQVVPKLLDFGISRVIADARSTHVGVVVGTPMYMGPEQASGAGATPASEVWSLAVVLYECLTGAGPYPSAEPGVLATLVLAGRVLPLAARYPTLPQHLCRTIESGLVLDPARRCRDMARFGAALLAAALADGIPLPSARETAGLPQYAAWLAAPPAASAPTVGVDPLLGGSPCVAGARRGSLAALAVAAAAALVGGWVSMRSAVSALSPPPPAVSPAALHVVHVQPPSVEALELPASPGRDEPVGPAARGPDLRTTGHGSSASRAPKRVRSEPVRTGAPRSTVKTALPQLPAVFDSANSAPARRASVELETRWE